MSRGLPKTVKENLEKCKSATIAAVEAYNRPGPRFRTAQYLVMIIIAWTALFHAIFYRRGKRPWYRQKTGGRVVRYQKIDGEPKHWDLSECTRHFYGGENPAVRQNLEFLIGLRNKIEHRHLPELDGSLYGECQAALLNLEELLVKEFGERHAMQDQLAVSLQFSRLTPAAKRRAAKVLASTGAKSVTDYIDKFRGRLPSSTLNSMKYSFNVFLVPRISSKRKSADAAVQFIPVDEASPEELERLERLNVLIREKHIPIQNLDLYKPSRVLEQVQASVPYRLNMSHHTAAWRYHEVRPSYGVGKPEKTKSQYCVYDEVHRDYVYTKAWIEKLEEDFSDKDRFRNIVGQDPEGK